MNIDFKIPYSTRPHMIKNLGPVFNNKPDPTYLIEKLSELNRFDADLYGSTDKKLEILLIKEACAHLKIPSADTIVDFALNFEEDVAILHKGLLQSICFCFPSSWVPSSRIGMSLEQIHQPVADNKYLLSASNQIATLIANRQSGSFKRQVWTITNNSQLSNHPENKIQIEPKTLDDLYFRLETQITEPFYIDSCLFFVKVDVIPLNKIWTKYSQQIKDSISSMSESILQYKNLLKIKSIILAD